MAELEEELEVLKEEMKTLKDGEYDVVIIIISFPMFLGVCGGIVARPNTYTS